jgi:hypothetical protein
MQVEMDKLANSLLQTQKQYEKELEEKEKKKFLGLGKFFGKK